MSLARHGRARSCEYDSDTLEYWVNTRTSGEMSREDLQRLCTTRYHDQEVGPEAALADKVDFGDGGFPDLGAADQSLELEGDSNLSAVWLQRFRGSL